ncbi:hypothetical protein AGDE_09356 [Angomonas deanei]|uniref:Pentacotripeptide-repeat region of PRORP/PPR repeat/Pentatricopeptide repeat domain containing protein, putative n=1 Tax=Angomonas deanei TaxID=59799 RepID=A0A7G2CCR6_9TRYP|nr:hypothetical protein AGDE_09356 [Angomonas deanei]CAD2216737.1 Pentacotripeptide-repeat region of PRORP/PPR repeat/Pentatricopeptide repeat domain containing protein, putative [Angomonas deanei]|eukprot:EPY30612.1 hypothetical protein AGDE_09356 [Angomonas deanei]
MFRVLRKPIQSILPSTNVAALASRKVWYSKCTAIALRPQTGKHFRPFSSEDEAQLTSVLSSKPRHVARHIRQSMLNSRKRVLQFRNSVTYLMILLQSRLQKKDISPAEATAIVESLMRECVDLHQGDMAHLLFRASIRFRKYGLEVTPPLVKYLYESYRKDNAKDLMNNMAEELCADEAFRFLSVLAFLFGGSASRAKELLAQIPKGTITTEEYCSLVETYGMTRAYDDIKALLKDLEGEPNVSLDAVYSAAACAVSGNHALINELVEAAIQKNIKFSEAAMGSILRSTFQYNEVNTINDVYAAEETLREQLQVPSLGMAAETAVISKCTEILSKTRASGDELMLQKISHLKAVIDTAVQNDEVDLIDSSLMMSLIKGYGVLAKFDEMKDCFETLKKAGAIKDHRLYDEMIKWFAYSYNLKEVIAFKEEMSENGIYHTPFTYHNVFKVLDKYYPRMVEKYLAEMRSKGMRIESFMYPTLLRVFAELQDFNTVERLYKEAKDRVSQEGGFLNPGVIIQMLRYNVNDLERCQAIIHDAENYGLLATQSVQAEILHLYSRNQKYEELQAFLAKIPNKSQDMYRVLLKDAVKRKDKKDFLRIISEIESSQMTVGERLFSVMIVGASNFRDGERVKKYISKAQDSDQVRTPMFFCDAAVAYSRLGDLDAVDQCWKDLLESKMVITMPVYNRFLDLYMNSNNMGMVQEILDTMMKLVPPNPVTATTVVDMLGKMGRIQEMEAVLDQMSKSANATPTLVTYHQAMNAYAKCGDVVKIEEVRDKIRKAGFQENHVTYNIMFEGYGRAKRYENLEELIQERKDKKIAMEEFGYVVLLNAYSRARMKENVEALVDEMVNSGVNLSSRMLATIASSYSAVENTTQMEHYIKILRNHPTAVCGMWSPSL